MNMLTFLVLVLLAPDGSVANTKPLAYTESAATCSKLAELLNHDSDKPANIKAVCVEPPKPLTRT